MKELLIVGAAGAVGGWVSTKYGATLEAQAVKFSVPPTLAHMLVVGSFTAIVFFVGTKVL